MKWFVASDIHGSAQGCRAMLSAYKNEGAHRLLLLGDILYHGPRNALPYEYNPPEVAKMLNGIKSDIVCLKGNCDSEVDGMVLEFAVTAEQMYIAEGKSLIFAHHGHKPLPCLPAGCIILQGHTHIAGVKKTDSGFVINPGSVSIPKGNTRAGYLIIENGAATLKALDGTAVQSVTL